MSAVQAVLELPELARGDAVPSVSDPSIIRLVHELRQPLSAIEAIAYYLEMTLPADQLDARQYLLRLQELVERSNVILSKAVDR